MRKKQQYCSNRLNSENYVSYHNVLKIKDEIEIYDTHDEYVEKENLEIRKHTLAKLSNKEKIVLGLI